MPRVFVTLVVLLLSGVVYADGIADAYPQARTFFPDADHFGPLAGDPRAAPVYKAGKPIGYLFLSKDIVRIPAYSGRPINNLVGLDMNGRIVGATIVEHEEPILQAGVSEDDLRRFVAQYPGKSALDRITVGAEREGYVAIDTISGATITVMVENATITGAARRVAESRGLGVVPKSAPRALVRPVTPPEPPAAAAPRADAPPVITSKTAPEILPMTIADEPLWVFVWQERKLKIALLVFGLVVLSLILVFQDFLAKHPTFLRRLRNAFLVYTLVFIGWYALGQLSVVNVLTFIHSAMHQFQWDTFLIDPMLFILWSFVAMTLLLWGRGVYCGWLCPFGALQELVYQVGQWFKLPKHEFAQAVHERLWALKYVILLALFGVSLQSMSQAEYMAEVEPFKTAINLYFMREWGYVLYAGGLVAVSLFNRKLYCKYLCPLGAALTIAAKFRIFDWLRRHRECGRPCQVCAEECEVQAIRKNGEINANECHYCLDCQVTYWNDRKCPPEVDRRKRRERALRAREVVGDTGRHEDDRAVRQDSA
ncbi:MAG: 4Fe-4S binding protein [Pseudomonadota bacterium]|nr:MAG: 4Fe-4S binding protein [Pseudomonadota bacterium]